MEEIAFEQARLHGLAALDALHVSAAHLLGADELVTAGDDNGMAVWRRITAAANSTPLGRVH